MLGKDGAHGGLERVRLTAAGQERERHEPEDQGGGERAQDRRPPERPAGRRRQGGDRRAEMGGGGVARESLRQEAPELRLLPWVLSELVGRHRA